MTVIPITLREANDFVESFHRHSKRTSRDGGKFAIGIEHDGKLVAIGILGRPLSRILDDGLTAEVTRTCCSLDAPKNCNSMIYGRLWRIWQIMGGKRIVTYTLQTESGASLKGAGWKIVAAPNGHPKGWVRKDSPQCKREWQPIYGQSKFRWEVAA